MFKTDNQRLFEWSISSICEYGWLVQNISLDLHNSELAKDNIMTEYEEKFSSQGFRIYRLEARRRLPQFMDRRRPVRKPRIKMNPFPYSDDNKRYHSYSYYLKHKYGCKVARVPLMAVLLALIVMERFFGGCLFCSEDGSGEQIEFPEKSLEIQFNAGIEKLSKWKDAKYLAYLQSFSGTYAHKQIKTIYSKCLNLPNVCGLVIATRADCINSEICDLLTNMSKNLYNNRTWSANHSR